MSTQNDGGPAYPVHANHVLIDGRVVAVHEQGMSIRDWFAGQALAGIMSSDGRPDGDQAKADWAYAMADAMLRAREGGGK